MATIAKLLEDGAIFNIDPELDLGALPNRCLYGLPSFRRFLDELPELGSTWNIDQSPLDQFDDLINEFLGSEPLTVSKRFGPIYPSKGSAWPGVWELKTADLRIFGWFPMKDVFFAAFGCTAERVKESNLYNGFKNEVVRIRANLPLDEPKFVSGRNFEDVVSLIYRPQK
jgi:hypothetical protein